LDAATAAAEAAADAAVSWARAPHNATLLARPPRGGVASLPLLVSAPLLSRELLPDGNWKTCRYQHGGTLVGSAAGAQGDTSGACAVWDALSSVCVVVSREAYNEAGEEAEPDAEADSAWRLDARFGADGGCTPATHARVDAPDVDEDAIAAAGAAAEGAPPPFGVPSWATLRAAAAGRVTVRSARDPSLWAANATEGTMVFARPQAERDAAGRVLLILGGLAVLTAALLGVPPALAARSRARSGGALLHSSGGGSSGGMRGRGSDCDS
jgi:hypothetical protein